MMAMDILTQDSKREGNRLRVRQGVCYREGQWTRPKEGKRHPNSMKQLRNVSVAEGVIDLL